MIKIQLGTQEIVIEDNELDLLLKILSQLRLAKFGRYEKQIKRLIEARNGNLHHTLIEYVELFNKCDNEEMADGLYYYLTKICSKIYLPSFKEFLDDYIGYFKNDVDLYNHYTEMKSKQISFVDFVESYKDFNFFGHCFINPD